MSNKYSNMYGEELHFIPEFYMQGYIDAIEGHIGFGRSLQAFLNDNVSPLMTWKDDAGHMAGCVAVHFGIDLSMKED